MGLSFVEVAYSQDRDRVGDALRKQTQENDADHDSEHALDLERVSPRYHSEYEMMIRE